MSLKAQIQRAVRAGISSMGDLAQRVTYISMGIPTYDATTGQVTMPRTTLANLPMVLARFSRREIDGDAVRAEDQKAVAATLDVPVTPTINDQLLDEQGVTWSVIGILGVPGQSVMTLHLRRP